LSCACALAFTLLAADAAPRRAPAVQAAIDKRDAAVTKAAATFASTVATANRELVREVETVQRRAMAAGDLSGANDAAAVKAEAESDPRAKGPPPPAVDTVPMLIGKWVIRDPGGTIHWTIRPTEARHSGTSGAGHISREGQRLIVKWDNGWVDRLVLTANGRVLKESWNVGNGRHYPQDPPEVLAVGVRE
jgi:hypothetical protein